MRDLGLPPSAVLVSISRNGRTIIPRGDVQLLTGDRLLLLVAVGGDSAVDAALTGARPATPVPGGEEYASPSRPAPAPSGTSHLRDHG
ncbi:MAG: hypothetical protein M1296_04760 [Chloroflexi bacterium]|nr:hypothetical protein [Chloroflexota bacterium]